MSYMSGTSSINNSLMENAFVDDSDDISSDETLFSISPNGFENLDSATATPLPTVVSPLYNSTAENSLFKASLFEELSAYKSIAEEKDATPVNNPRELKQPQVSFKILVSPVMYPKPPSQSQLIVTTSQPQAAAPPTTAVVVVQHPQPQPLQPKTVVIKTPPPAPVAKIDMPAAKNDIPVAVHPAATKTEVTTSKHDIHCQCGQIKLTQQEILNTSKLESILNQVNYNPKPSATTLTATAATTAATSTSKIYSISNGLDMKSQMAKYNEYLHYLRFGFPKRK